MTFWRNLIFAAPVSNNYQYWYDLAAGAGYRDYPALFQRRRKLSGHIVSGNRAGAQRMLFQPYPGAKHHFCEESVVSLFQIMKLFSRQGLLTKFFPLPIIIKKNSFPQKTVKGIRCGFAGRRESAAGVSRCRGPHE